MTQKLTINQDMCIGCNTCPSLDPETFELDPTNFKAKVKRQPAEITEEIKSVIKTCPVGAIQVIEEA
ncbi:MAG TPA: ferredoxin [Candidatus Woesebacteria bacterium]|nr:ferredoxin [Candidatus Woesebacteria bacterium]HRT40186.1 ferredoxin [Candidatus Woesebacteria bacterium]